MTNRTTLSLLVAVGLLITACSMRGPSPIGAAAGAQSAEPTALSVEQLGAECPPADLAPLSEYFGYVTSVVRISSDDVVASAIGASITEHGSAEMSSLLHSQSLQPITSGSTPVRLQLGPQDIAETRRLPEQESVLVASRGSADNSWVQFIIVEKTDGDLVFAGSCGAMFRSHLVGYRDVARPGETLAVVFHDVVTSDADWADYNNWDLSLGRFAPTPFEERPPRNRLLDPDEAPHGVLEALTPFVIELSVPVEWFSIDGAALCTFVSEGWNECFALEASTDETVTLTGFGALSEDVEIWLVDYKQAGIAEPLTEVGSIRLPASVDSVLIASVQGGAFSSLEEIQKSRISVVLNG